MHWTLIVYSGVITFLTRFSMIFLLKKDIFNNETKKILSFVPAAIFPAIIFPPIFLDSAGSLDLEGNPQILAAIFSGLIMYWMLIFLFNF